MDKLYDMMEFKLLNIRQQKILIIHSQKTNEGNPPTILVSCLKNTSRFQTVVQEGRTQAEFAQFSELRRQS